jgi:hypothetical protein
MFQHFSQRFGTPVTLIRLNYANELRYGILVDLTLKVLHGEPIDVTMGAVNLIWQGDANNYIIRALGIAKSPPAVLNVTGAQTLYVRDLAGRIGKVLGKEPRFVSQEADTALLSNASQCCGLFGPPAMTLDEMIQAIVPWVAAAPVLKPPSSLRARQILKGTDARTECFQRLSEGCVIPAHPLTNRREQARRALPESTDAILSRRRRGRCGGGRAHDPVCHP